MRKSDRLRELLTSEHGFLLPGAFNALSAKLMEKAGFEAVYVSGSAIAMSEFGYPDVGLTTMMEVVEQARRICSAVEIPVIMDMDNGFGNSLNVLRCVRECETAGVAGIQLEDQQFPKKCGHFEGKKVIEKEEMVGKLKAAVAARKQGLFIIARTDAYAVNGLDDAIDRARAYHEAGADLIFVEAPQDKESLQKITSALRMPLLVNVVEGGKTPQLSFQEYVDMGYRVVLYPTAGIRIVSKALIALYAELKQSGSTEHILDSMITFEERNQLNDLKWYEEWENRFSG